MAKVTEEYKRLVLDDVRSFEKLNHPVKAGLAERLLVRKLPAASLHPNPQDEFSMEAVGPNYGIVSDYEKMFRDRLLFGQEPFGAYDEPITVEKMSTGGYMILNGHHRWLAARRIGLSRLPVHIVNVTTVEDVLATVSRSDKNMCASFDLDEILLTDGGLYPVQKELSFPYDRIYKKTLRKNAAVLINELRRIGFDVWVYTGEYYSELYINTLFRLNGAEVDGIINGMRRAGTRKDFRETFGKKYRISLHIDNNDVLCVKPGTKEYESYPLDTVGQDWASEVMERLKEHKEFWHEHDESVL